MILPLENTAMPWAVTGPLGSGKSLVAVATMVDSLASRRCQLVSNIHLNLDEVSKFAGYDVRMYVHYIDLMAPNFDPFSLPCGTPRGYRGSDAVRVLVVLDECAEFFDQYSSAKDRRIEKFLSWLRHSSKRGQDVFLIVQNRDFLNKSLRQLCARFVVCTNLSLVKLPIIHLSLLPRVSVAVVYDRYGNRGGLAPVFLRQSKWGKYYDTAEQISNYTGFQPPKIAEVSGDFGSSILFKVFVAFLVYSILLLFA